MNSETTAGFWKLYAALPPDVRRQAIRAHAQFVRDPFYPGLTFKEVNKRKGLWSARISDDYRVLGYRENSQVTWFWIGKHDEYEKLIARH